MYLSDIHTKAVHITESEQRTAALPTRERSLLRLRFTTENLGSYKQQVLNSLCQNRLKQTMRFMYVFTLFQFCKNELSSGCSLLLHKFIKSVMKMASLIITKCCCHKTIPVAELFTA